MTGYRVRLKNGIPKAYIAAEKEDLKTIYALPNAFGRYKDDRMTIMKRRRLAASYG